MSERLDSSPDHFDDCLVKGSMVPPNVLANSSWMSQSGSGQAFGTLYTRERPIFGITCFNILISAWHICHFLPSNSQDHCSP
jgi:hypothetical protein